MMDRTFLWLTNGAGQRRRWRLYAILIPAFIAAEVVLTSFSHDIRLCRAD